MLISPPLLADGTHILLTESLYTTPRWVISRSEEHTSELQSQSNLVCRLLLEKKKDLRQMLPRVVHSLDHCQALRTRPSCDLFLAGEGVAHILDRSVIQEAINVVHLCAALDFT